MRNRIIGLSAVVIGLTAVFINYQNFISPAPEQNTGYLESTRMITLNDIKLNDTLFKDAIENKVCDDVGIDPNGKLVANFQPLAQGTPQCVSLFKENQTFKSVISYSASKKSNLFLANSTQTKFNVVMNPNLVTFATTLTKAALEPKQNLNKIAALRKALDSYYSGSNSNSTLPVFADNSINKAFSHGYITNGKIYTGGTEKKIADLVLTNKSLENVKIVLANGALVKTTIQVYDNFIAFPSGNMVPYKLYGSSNAVPADTSCKFNYTTDSKAGVPIYDIKVNCDKTAKGRTHQIMIVGYDDTIEAFKVMNSWDVGWGQGGMAWVSYKLFQDVDFSSNAFMATPPNTALANCSPLPENAAFCTGDDTGLTSNSLTSANVASCTTNTKCEYTCKKGFLYSASDKTCNTDPNSCEDFKTFNATSKTCETNTCIDAKMPTDSIACEGSDTNLDSTSINKNYVTKCDPKKDKKCEYTCPQNKFINKDKTACISFACAGAVVKNSIPCDTEGDKQLTNATTLRTLVATCSNKNKCEYQCDPTTSTYDSTLKTCKKIPASCNIKLSVKDDEYATSAFKYTFLKASIAYKGAVDKATLTFLCAGQASRKLKITDTLLEDIPMGLKNTNCTLTFKDTDKVPQSCTSNTISIKECSAGETTTMYKYSIAETQEGCDAATEVLTCTDKFLFSKPKLAYTNKTCKVATTEAPTIPKGKTDGNCYISYYDSSNKIVSNSVKLNDYMIFYKSPCATGAKEPADQEPIYAKCVKDGMQTVDIYGNTDSNSQFIFDKFTTFAPVYNCMNATMKPKSSANTSSLGCFAYVYDQNGKLKPSQEYVALKDQKIYSNEECSSDSKMKYTFRCEENPDNIKDASGKITTRYQNILKQNGGFLKLDITGKIPVYDCGYNTATPTPTPKSGTTTTTTTPTNTTTTTTPTTTTTTTTTPTTREIPDPLKYCYYTEYDGNPPKKSRDSVRLSPGETTISQETCNAVSNAVPYKCYTTNIPGTPQCIKKCPNNGSCPETSTGISGCLGAMNVPVYINRCK